MRPWHRARTVRSMGFLDKAMKAATAAKDQVDELRDMRATSQHRPTVAGAPDEHEERVLGRALALGAPEPYALLSLEEASQIAGVPLGGPRLVYGDDTIGVGYTATGPRQRYWSVEVQAFYAVDDDTDFDAAVHWHTYLADIVRDDGLPIGDLGDAAIARDGEVFVLAGPLLFFTTVRLPDGAPATDHALRAARRVLTRLD
jgi:hypothetical protein